MQNPQTLDSLLKEHDPSFEALIQVLNRVREGSDLESIGIIDKTEQQHCRLVVLRKALETAIVLEFTTIPPYLCALWSIVDELHETAQSIREVVQEEMLHMALACNMLRSIGGEPNIATRCPSYPTRLPGKIHTDLEIDLSGLTKQTLKVFMRIEQPAEVIPHGHDKGGRNSSASTIGEFYKCVQSLFEALEPPMETEGQISGPLANMVIADLSDVQQAIKTIIDQGEGSMETPQDTGLDDLAHYYRFEELYEGRKLEYDATKEPPYFHGRELGWPEVLPMQSVPLGGYGKEDVSKEAWKLIEGFDLAYSRMVDLLDSAWNRGGQAAFLRSLELMFELEEYAKPLMRMSMSKGISNTLGPCFRYLKKDQR